MSEKMWLPLRIVKTKKVTLSTPVLKVWILRPEKVKKKREREREKEKQRKPFERISTSGDTTGVEAQDCGPSSLTVCSFHYASSRSHIFTYFFH